MSANNRLHAGVPTESPAELPQPVAPHESNRLPARWQATTDTAPLAGKESDREDDYQVLLIRGSKRAVGSSGKALLKAIVACVLAWAALELLFVAFVHRDLEGDSHRAFLPSQLLGVGEREAAAGLRPVSQLGYDGQHYYTISNDLFGLRDGAQHVDNVAYRYQRIGLPAIAGGLASLLGYELTPPMLFHSLNIGLTAIGFGAMVYWLLVHQIRGVFALGWLLSVGTMQSLTLGILDAPADALFMLMMLAMLAGRLWIYLPIAVLLLLTREMYALVAFGVFAFTVLDRFPWKDAPGYWKRVTLTALPGGTMLLWMAYVALHFHRSPLAARGEPGMKSYPFYAMYKAIALFFSTANWGQVWPALAVALMLVVVCVSLTRNVRRLPLALLCVIPYVLMSASLGTAIWEEYAGSARIMNTMIVLGLLLMPYDKSIILPLLIGLQAVMGITVTAETRLANSTIRSPYLVHEDGSYKPNPPGSPINKLLDDPRCRIEWIDAQPICKRKYDGIWNWAHRELLPVKIAITNLTESTWHPGLSPHAIWLAYNIYDPSHNPERFVCRRAVILDQEIPPGETREVTTYLELRQPGQRFVVEFSPWQEGPGTFSHVNPSYGQRYEFTVE